MKMISKRSAPVDPAQLKAIRDKLNEIGVAVGEARSFVWLLDEDQYEKGFEEPLNGSRHGAIIALLNACRDRLNRVDELSADIGQCTHELARTATSTVSVEHAQAGKHISTTGAA